jgi:hypothetical protein
MRFGYEGIKSVKSGSVRLAENNKTVNKVYLDLVDELENTANFTFSIDQAEHVANQLLQAVFELTESKPEDRNHRQMWNDILSIILLGEPYMSEFHRFVDRLVFNRFEPYNGDLHLTSNAINKNVIGNVIECMFDALNGYDTGYHPVMKIIIHDNIDKKEYHFKFNGEKQVVEV